MTYAKLKKALAKAKTQDEKDRAWLVWAAYVDQVMGELRAATRDLKGYVKVAEDTKVVVDGIAALMGIVVGDEEERKRFQGILSMIKKEQEARDAASGKTD